MPNSELRKRKIKQHNERSNKTISKKRKDKTVSGIHTSLLCLILSGTILTLFIILYTDQIPWIIGHRAIDSIANKVLGYHKPVYAVIIDAGSTGSRVLAYTFHESYLGNHLILDKELFEYTKPGLSSFAKEPKKGAATIAHLLDLAKDEIPEQYWSNTPLTLKATAGLRMLPADQAEKLLDSVKEVFRKSPFLTTNESVEIMDGTDEGIFSWFTVNFLLDRLNGDPTNTVAALDLGGGSTQVTFAAMTPASLKEQEKIQQVASPSGQMSVYTNSFTGLGLMAARHAVITLNQPNALNVTSDCVNPIINRKKFMYHDTLGMDTYIEVNGGCFNACKCLTNYIATYFKNDAGKFSTLDLELGYESGYGEVIASMVVTTRYVDDIHKRCDNELATDTLGMDTYIEVNGGCFNACKCLTNYIATYFKNDAGKFSTLDLELGYESGYGEVIASMVVTTRYVDDIHKRCDNELATGAEYYVSGLQKDYPTSDIKGSDIMVGEVVPIVSFQDCSKIISDYVKSKASPPEELPLKKIFAFSYYFDRAIEVGLIDEAKGGSILVKDFKGAAERVCHEANVEQPFMCLDLTFIWVLLNEGCGLKDTTKIYLHKKIGGHEISWALGAAYDLLRG